MGVFLCKFVSNEIFFGYLGELYFYVWVWCNVYVMMVFFGVIKDLMILSVLIGNLVILVMVLLIVLLFCLFYFGMDNRVFVGLMIFILLFFVGMLVLCK